MISLHLTTKFLIIFLIVGTLIWGGIFLRPSRLKNKGKGFTDRQMIWLLLGLLMIAAISMGAFLSILLEGLEPWHYLQI
jgi:hypothetical protein